MIVSIDNIDYR